MIAARNSPAEPGATRWSHTDMPPADSPAMVTLSGIAAEVGDVVAHPAQRRLLVGQAVVADVARRTQRRMGQEAERAEPVVDA